MTDERAEKLEALMAAVEIMCDEWANEGKPFKRTPLRKAARAVVKAWLDRVYECGDVVRVMTELDEVE